jgi:hypothetical protein
MHAKIPSVLFFVDMRRLVTFIRLLPCSLQLLNTKQNRRGEGEGGSGYVSLRVKGLIVTTVYFTLLSSHLSEGTEI